MLPLNAAPAVGTPEHDELPDHGQVIADAAVKEAVEKGVTYFDCAPGYWNFRGMERLGPALAPYRDQVFLACKTGKRDAKGAQEELDRSLKLMQTDHFDLYQLHGMSTMEDYDKAMAPGGAMEVLRAAKAAGVVKNIGFSAHHEGCACALIATGEFDSILTAFNFVSWTEGGFGHEMMAAAKEQNMAVLGIKALARCRYMRNEDKKYSSCWYAPEEDPEFQERLYKYSLSLGVSVCVSPVRQASTERLFRRLLLLFTLPIPLRKHRLTARVSRGRSSILMR
jgi:predicted aldo/keto reductase-like oxidoreductase